MTRNLLTILSIIITLCFAPSITNEAHARIEMSEIETTTPKIELNSNTLVITGASGKMLYIYNLIGVPVMSVKIDSDLKKIDLTNLPKGVYPVKVGSTTKKISLLGR